MVVRSFPCHLITYEGEDMLLLERKGGKLFVTAKMFREDEEAYVRIDKNIVTPGSTPPVHETQVSAHRLIVQSTKFKQVLDIEYLNPQAIRITGDFCIRGGVHCDIKMDTQVIGGWRMNGPGVVDGVGFDYEDNGRTLRVRGQSESVMFAPP
jgi:hypothetical protein